MIPRPAIFRRSPCTLRALAGSLLLGTAVLGGVCTATAGAAEQAPLAGNGEDPFNRIHSAELENGKVVGYSAADLPKAAFSTGGMAAAASKAASPPRRPTSSTPSSVAKPQPLRGALFRRLS